MLSLLCWKCEFGTDVKIENYITMMGKQLLFHKNVHIKTQQKQVCFCNLHIIARNEEFQFIW